MVIIMVKEFYIEQEAMESSAFPDKIKMKWMKSKMYRIINIFMSNKITQKRSKQCLFNWNLCKTPFFISIATQKEMHQSKKGQHKNLAQAYTKRKHQKGTLQKCVIWAC